MKTNIVGSILVGLLAVSASLGCSVRAAESSALRAEAEKAFAQLTKSSVESLEAAARQARAKGGAVEPKFRIVCPMIPAVAVSTASQTSTTDSQTTTTTANSTATATTDSQATTVNSTANATTDSQATTVNSTATTDSQTTTATATSSSAPSTDAQIGVKVWFELPDGTCVNPAKKKWNAKEKFYIHVESAVPVYVSLFQNYPESRPTTRQIYPDKEYADSFKALQPGKESKLPVMFETDDDTRDEIISIVVVRSDWEGIQNGLTTQATASVSTDGGTAQVTAQVTSSGAGTLKCVGERMASNNELTVADAKQLVKGLSDKNATALCKTVNNAAPLAKVKIVGSTKTTSETPEDVCNYVFGAGYVAQWQLTISK